MMKISIKKTKGFTLGELLLVFGILLAVGALLLPVIRHNQMRMNRITCANNLREVGLALYIYAREHNGDFPPTLKTLYEEEYLADPALMDCPASPERGSIEAPTYVYTPGLTVKDPSLDVLVVDRTGNHPGDGKNMLLVNGTILWREKE